MAQKSGREKDITDFGKISYQPTRTKGIDHKSTPSKTKDAEKLSFRAAVVIQCWYRKCMAKLELRRRCAWQVHKSMEYVLDDNDARELNTIIGLTLVVETFYSHRRNRKEEKIVRCADSNGGNKFDEDDPNLWTRLEFPLSEAQFHSMVKSANSNDKPGVSFLVELLTKSTDQFKLKPNIAHINLEDQQSIVVCGDLHGNLPATLSIFERNGYPCKEKLFLFNGDFVDRGFRSIEVLTLLLTAFLVYPDYVFLNRGNHEDYSVNEHYGFKIEMERKYPISESNLRFLSRSMWSQLLKVLVLKKKLGNHRIPVFIHRDNKFQIHCWTTPFKMGKVIEIEKESKQLLHLCCDLFRTLPIAALINETILICHGGISKHTNLQRLECLERMKFASVLKPSLRGEDAVNLNDWQQILDLLWSDPQPQPGCRPNAYRGGGCYFGPDITETCLNNSNLKMIVRSHECCPDGWKMSHLGQVLTLFSSFDYYALHSNKGAYAMITSCESSAQFLSSNEAKVSLKPIPLVSNLPGRYKTVHNQFNIKSNKILAFLFLEIYEMERVQRRGSTEPEMKNPEIESAFLRLWQRIIHKKPEIIELLKEADTFESGDVSKSQWFNIMEHVTGLKVSWPCLRQFLVKLVPGDHSRIMYTSMFSGKCVTHPEIPDDDQFVQQLFKVKSRLLALARMANNSNTEDVNLLNLRSGIGKTEKNAANNELYDILCKLIDRFDRETVSHFNLDKFLDSFWFVECQKRR